MDPGGFKSAANCRGTGGLGRARGDGEIRVHEVRSPRSTSLSLTQILQVVTGLYPYPLTHARKMSVAPSVNPSLPKRATGATACLPKKNGELYVRCQEKE